MANFERISKLGQQLDQVDAVSGNDGHAFLPLRRWNNAAQLLHSFDDLGISGIVLELGVSELDQVLAGHTERSRVDAFAFLK